MRWAEHVNPFMDLDAILNGDDGIEYYLDTVLYNPVASTI
jgi:hypothetical protein